MFVKASPIKVPQVYEKLEEYKDIGGDSNIRVTRYPKFYHIPDPPIFDYRKVVQQDRQRLRYAQQQQQVDSYVQAYQNEHQARRASKTRQETKQVNLISPAARAKTAYDTRSKSENSSSRQINFNYFPVEADIGISDQYKQKKVVDPKTPQRSPSNKFLISDNSRELQSIGHQNKKLSSSGQPEKVPSYQVSEGIADQEPEASNYREAKVYIGNQDLSPNYLAKPTYVFADPQLNIDPKLLMQGLTYSLPENHQLTSEGFHPASQSDIEALNSLLGKSPNAQLQGLNELLEQQSTHTVHPIHPAHSIYPVSGPSATISVQPESLISVGPKDFTPIKEEIHDVSNIQDKPNIHVTLPQVDIKSHTSINHQVQIVPEVKSVYEGDGDNVSIHKQTVNVNKVKRDVESASQADDYEMYEYDDNENTTEFYYDVVTDDYLVEFEATTEFPIFNYAANRRVFVNTHLSKNYVHSIYPSAVKDDSIDKIEYGDKINPKGTSIEEIIGKKDPTNVIVINNSNDNNNKGSNVNIKNNHEPAHTKVRTKKIPVKQLVKTTKAKKVQTRYRFNRINRKLKKVNGVLHKLKKKRLL